jgi:hypothetical protein
LRGSVQKGEPFWPHPLAKQLAFAAHQAGDLMPRAYWIKLASAPLKQRAYCPRVSIVSHELAP